MPAPQTADEIVADKFLEVRAKLLEIAATLDRVDRASADSSLSDEAAHRRDALQKGIEIIASEGSDRAARLQMLYSREYQPGWRETFGMKSS
ncbi:hypothetical protein [Rhodopirellula sp. MGV]|uniref:hypothetical protein n=1 Tax=Rhodopirellula sp. MGV TaxID=2023130 RepID=UPI000B969E88|nr:hypothetical protein [Rhodopirellula sp. MGV]OYP35706.1 hypothetical protein CGZ80_11025 [Rhodopirellula sp. MGV]PNY35002.1 hypothetical protein C2E31_20505 [Rhodopirellula baltica]